MKWKPKYICVENNNDIERVVAWLLNCQEDDSIDSDFLKENNRGYRILCSLFTALLDYVRCKSGIFSLLIEEHYVDSVYRDSYYFFFSGKHTIYNRDCKRILLFEGKFEGILDLPVEDLQEKFVGSVVIRPLEVQAIGRTLLNPKYFSNNKKCYMRLAKYNVTAFGKRLSVQAFPFSMQDGETTTCAEITILGLLDYYSKSYSNYRSFLPSEINKLAQENGYERSIPSQGLRYEVISKIFCEAGFYPRLYSSMKMRIHEFKRIIYYYVESGIPLSLGIETTNSNWHSVIAIGHGNVQYARERLEDHIYASSDCSVYDNMNIECNEGTNARFDIRQQLTFTSKRTAFPP